MPDGPPPSAADRFAALIWGLFVEGHVLDGSDLQDAFIVAGMAYTRPATETEVAGTDFDAGEDCLFLTEEGFRLVTAGRRSLAS